MNRFRIATIIALVASCLSILGVCLGGLSNGGMFSETVMLLGGAVGLVSYLFAGLWTAIKMVIGLAFIGFRIGPFPINIVIGLATCMYAALAFVFIPIIPVLRARRA